MRLNEQGLVNRKQWEEKGYNLPKFDREAVTAATKENPFWIHFGPGNIFRAFQANVVQNLLNAGLLDRGLVVAEGYDYALAVSGGILTTKVLVKEVTEWYDHVFDDEYELIAIDELSRFVKENGHLPDMPSEYNVLDKGYDMVEMDGLLLKKIEELTLYTIELNALIKHQQELIDSLLTK